MSEAYPEILERRGRPVCVLATGDPFHYGVGAELARLIAADEIVCFPQASAFSLAAGRLGWSLPDCACLSLHGRALERIIPYLQPGARLIALSWDGTTPARLAALLAERGFGRSVLTVLEAMGGQRERIRRAIAAALDLHDVDPLNTIGLEIVADADARIVTLAPGLDDSWFENDGQLTKGESRALTLSALALATGTGSPVSIDSSMRLEPSMTTPSTGIFSPGFTRSRSPTTISPSGTCSSDPSSRIRHARFGASRSNSLIAWLVRPVARS